MSSPGDPLDIEFIRRALSLPRPGLTAQLLMCPRPRTPGVTAPARYRDGGVLLLLYPRNGSLHLVLTRRCDHLSAHAGQISLPGGLQEPHDRSLIETALRETQEELGLDTAGLELLGPLTPLEIPVSGYRIHPWVAYSPTAPAFDPDPDEVAELLEVRLSDLLDPLLAGVETRPIRGYQVEVPFYRLGAHKVWGATAMVLSEFLALVREAQKGAGVGASGE